MLKPTRIAVSVLLLGLAVPFCASAKDGIPDLTQGGVRDKAHDWTLGPTGARGWMWGKDLETTQARQILVTKVEKGSPADGILNEGDVILGVGETLFDSDARKVFARAITEAEKTGNKGRLQLVRWRAGKQENVAVTIPVLGTYSATAPFNCPKTAGIVDAECAFLLKHGFGTGLSGNVNALGALATGRSEFMSMLREHARKVGPADLKLSVTSGGMSAWDWGYSGLFLAEYYLATRDRSVLPALREYAMNMARGQSGAGAWGHGMAWTALNGGQLHGSLGGYGEMNQPGLTCLMSLVLARECGIKDQEVDAAIDRAALFLRFYVNRGAIPYGDHDPWYDHDDNGKCSSGAVVFDLLGDKEAATFFSRMTVASWSVREAGHTGNYLSFLWGPLGAGRAGTAAAVAYLNELRWFLDMERDWNGGSQYQGGAGSDDSFGGWDCTGARLLANSLPLRKLRITGKGNGVAARLTGADLEDVIETDRGLQWSTRESLYAGMDSEELFRRLGNWSPIVRHRAAAGLALAAKDDAGILPRVMTLLAGDNRNARYGACMTLERMRDQAVSAVPALTTLLPSEDLELRIRVIRALAGIGEPARTAVPDLLRLAHRTFADDPREITQRQISEALFAKHGAGGSRGLLSESLNGVDLGLLFPAIEKLLQNENGQVRSNTANVYKLLTFEQIKPILASIVRASSVPAPSGTMFAAGVRDEGLRLLTTNCVKEGIPLLVQYARNQQQWGSQDRMVMIMGMLERYGVHAKQALPELRELATWCRSEEDFPEWARQKKREAVEAAIQRIEVSTEAPALINLPAPTP